MKKKWTENIYTDDGGDIDSIFNNITFLDIFGWRRSKKKNCRFINLVIYIDLSL